MILAFAAFAASLTLSVQAPVVMPQAAAQAGAAPAVPQAVPDQAATPAAPTQIAAIAPTEPHQVCSREYTTGTRFSRMVCRTVDQSQADQVDSRETLRRLQGTRMPDAQ